MILAPYLFFNGNCEEALLFYKHCFEGEINVLNRYEDAPMQIPDNYRHKVMHAELRFENNRIQACDIHPAEKWINGTDFSLSIGVDEVFVLDKVFNKLAEGGNITMPLQDTFWGARFGMIKDKFGVKWMFSCDLN